MYTRALFAANPAAIIAPIPLPPPGNQGYFSGEITQVLCAKLVRRRGRILPSHGLRHLLFEEEVLARFLAVTRGWSVTQGNYCTPAIVL